MLNMTTDIWRKHIAFTTSALYRNTSPCIPNFLTSCLVCILPFPALIRIREKRLRYAVCGVYLLTLIVIIFSTIRIVLLGVNAQANIKYVMVITMAELTTVVIVGAVPGISSIFTRKYVEGQGNLGTQYATPKLSRRPQPSTREGNTWLEIDDDTESQEGLKTGVTHRQFINKAISTETSTEIAYNLKEVGNVGVTTRVWN